MEKESNPPTAEKSNTHDTEDMQSQISALAQLLSQWIDESSLLDILTPEKINTPAIIENKKCLTVLQLIVRKGYLDYIPLILKAGADINLKYDDGKTILHQVASMDCALEASKVDLVERLISKENINSQTNEKESALHYAAKLQPSLIPILVEHGIDINLHENTCRYCALHTACEASTIRYPGTKEEQLQWVSMLISTETINLEERWNKRTPLYEAIARKPDWVPLLVQSGASVNHMVETDEVPLTFSTNRCFCDISVSVMELVMPNEPFHRLQAIIFAFFWAPHSPNDFDLLKCLIENATPMKISAVKVSDGRISLENDLVINGMFTTRLKDSSDCKILSLVCLLLEGTCFFEANAEIKEDAQYYRDSCRKELRKLEKAITMEPPSLSKMATLTIRAGVLKNGIAKGFEELGLPAGLIRILKLEDLASSLQQRWKLLWHAIVHNVTVE